MGEMGAVGKLALELRRGVVILTTLSQLRTPRYADELLQALAGNGLPIEEGTLSALLRRLESQGWLKREWTVQDGPSRRDDALNAQGRKLLKPLTGAWQGLNNARGRLLQEG